MDMRRRFSMQMFCFTPSAGALFWEKMLKLYTLEKGEEVQSEESYLDTFDWSLYKKDWIVRQSGNETVLQSLTAPEALAMVWPAEKNYPLSEDLQGEGGEKCRSWLAGRALVRHFTLRRSTQTFRLVDRTTLAAPGTLIHQTFAFPTEAKAVVVQVQPRRGASVQMQPVFSLLRAEGGKKIRDVNFAMLASWANIKPASYSSKYSGNFQPKLAAQLAVFRILADLFQIAKQNQWGVIADVDSEFLHDYRTAIRRMRSIAAECQEVLPQDIVVRLKTDFRTLGKATNRLRDFDVFLQRQAEYQAAVPAILGSGLDQLFDAMRKKRQKTCDQLQAFLRDPSYERMVDDWDRFFTLQSHISSAPASPTVLELARKTIANRYHRILEQGAAISEASEDGQVHALRIECKKLRYLLEVFASLFPRQDVDRFVTLLKTVQDNLGLHNDLVVQQQKLMAFADKKSVLKENAMSIAAAGALVGMLVERRRHLRTDFKAIFAEFTRPENRQFMEKM